MNGLRRRCGSGGGRKGFLAKVEESLDRGGALLLGHREEPAMRAHSGERER